MFVISLSSTTNYYSTLSNLLSLAVFGGHPNCIRNITKLVKTLHGGKNLYNVPESHPS